jgi:hypothetical protein
VDLDAMLRSRAAGALSLRLKERNRGSERGVRQAVGQQASVTQHLPTMLLGVVMIPVAAGLGS